MNIVNNDNIGSAYTNGVGENTMTLGDKIDAYADQRQRITKSEQILNKLKKEEQALKASLLTDLEALGLDKASGKKATVSVKKEEIPKVTDWDKVNAYMKANDAHYLLARSLVPLHWRAEVADKGPIEGISIFSKTKMNYRKI